MYAKLGNIIFQQQKGFSTLKSDYATKYAEHSLISGKPRLERTGEDLESLNISLTLHKSFADPLEAFNELNAARIAGEILPLVLGNGEYINDFVITGITKDIVQTAPDGTVIFMILGIGLKEYFNPDVSYEERAKAIAESINANPANLQNEPSPGFETRGEGTQAVELVTEVKGQTIVVDNAVKDYEKNANLKERSERIITAALNKMTVAYNKLDGLLATGEGLYQLAVNLPAQIEAAKNAISSMEAALPIQSLAEIRSNNTNLLAATDRVGLASRDIFNLNISRKI